jgi:Ca2+-binding EF-hand superfamily protein
MKPILYGLLFAGLAAPVLAQGLPGGGSFDQAVDQAAWAAEFNAADKDGDGRISREEALSANPNLGDHFDAIDADGDGFISPEEDRAMLDRGIK